MIIVSHPTGNQNVRQVLLTFLDAGILECFNTTISWRSNAFIDGMLPSRIHAELSRRSYQRIPQRDIITNPLREALRLLTARCGLREPDLISVQRIAKVVDRSASKAIRQRRPRAVYAYEGAALQSFREAKRQGATCIYELPSGYWYYEKELLLEEAQLRPEYADTIQKLKDSQEHLDQKDEELALADEVVVPSSHVLRTLSRAPVTTQRIHIVPYGANENRTFVKKPGRSKDAKLRVLFVGALTQRKGISYALEAIAQLGSRVEFTLIGSRVGNSKPLDRALQNYRWIQSLAHQAVLDMMAESDVLLLPSLSEGFALVISEALSRGTPVITTRNSGSEEIIRDGVEGFLVPLRSSEEIAQKLDLLDRNRDLLEAMSVAALQRATDLSWTRYRERVLLTVESFLEL